MSDLGYHARANQDLQEIWTLVALRNGVTVADGLTDGIRETLLRVIARHPQAGRVRPEFGTDIRSFPIVPYVVFYRVVDRRALMLRILHGHRDIKEPLMSLLAAAS